MEEPPRSRATASDTPPATPHRWYSSALAHNAAGAPGTGSPRRSADRSFQTPRDERRGDRSGRPGTLPPVPGRPIRVLLLCLALFALLTWQVAVHGPLWRQDVAADGSVLRAAARHPALTVPAQVLADLGSVTVAVPELAALLAVVTCLHRRAGRRRWWWPLAAAVPVMAAVPSLVVPLKAALARPAPGTSVLVGHSGYFPSGHASTAAVATGLAVLLFLPLLRTRAARRLLVAAVLLLNVLVGCALVWRGYHWPLDVAGAWCLSGALLALARRLTGSWGSPG